MNKTKCETCGKPVTHKHYKYYKEKPLSWKVNHRLIAEKHPEWFIDLCNLCHSKLHGISPNKSELKRLVIFRERAIIIRNALKNQIRGFSGIEYVVPNYWEKEAEVWNKQIKKFEKEIRGVLDCRNQGENHNNPAYPITPWLLNIKGISHTTVAKLLSHIDIKNTPTISALWQYCGCGDPEYIKRKRGMKQEEAKKCGSPYLKKEILGVLSDSFIKQRTPKYRDIYDREKVKQLEIVKTKNHAHRRAIRKMMKEFLKDFWIAWREAEGLEVSEPWIVWKNKK